MKFSEKYELLETLTTGAVETFVAHDKVRGERVLVHIVECPTQKAEQTTAEWVLGAFRNQAPEPPGAVLETGKYSGPKYGYVVIKARDESAVRSWVRQYELQADETKETNVHPSAEALNAAVRSSPAPPVVVEQSPQPSGSMTQLFRDFDALAKSKGPDVTAPADLPAEKPSHPISRPGDSGIHTANPWDGPSARTSPLPDEPRFPSPPTPAKGAAPDLASSVSRQSSKPGEFTSFFQGPFQGDNPAEMPSFSSQPIEPPKKTVGEFTAIFGRTSAPAQGSPASSSASEQSFTSIFKDMPPQPAFNTPPAVQGGVIPTQVQPLPAVPQVNAPSLPDPVFVAPTPVVTPPPPAPSSPQSLSSAVEAPPAPRSRSLPSNDATGAFMRPSPDPTPVPVETPSGPSPYTQIISRPKHTDSEEAAPAATPSATGPQYAAPPMPKIPKAAPPPLPKMPPAPRLAPPPVPKMKAPQTPKIPKLDAPSPPPVSMWPLIITLTVLFFLAVILVLYFVLRH